MTAAKKKARRKSGPKPGFQPAVNIRRAEAKALAAAQAAAAAEIRPHKDPLARSKDIKGMSHDELRVYGKQIGVRQRDIDELSEDRLRQNCHLTVASLLEALME